MTVATLPPVADQRILVGADATLYAQFRDQWGEPTAAGTVVASAVDATGASVLTDTTASYDSTTNTYSVSLTALSSLELLDVTWTGSVSTSTKVEVVGGYYFSIADVRAYKNGVMSSTDTYPNALVRAARDEVEREFERVCWPFVPRYRRVVMPATGCRQLALQDMHVRTVRSVVEYDADGTASYTWTADDLAGLYWDASGIVTSTYKTFGWLPGTVAVEYEYGFDRPPADVVEAALRRLRHKMNADKSGVPDRAVSYTVAEGGSYSLSTPGRNNAVTGIPDVDVVLNDPRYRRPLFGFA